MSTYVVHAVLCTYPWILFFTPNIFSFAQYRLRLGAYCVAIFISSERNNYGDYGVVSNSHFPNFFLFTIFAVPCRLSGVQFRCEVRCECTLFIIEKMVNGANIRAKRNEMEKLRDLFHAYMLLLFVCLDNTWRRQQLWFLLTLNTCSYTGSLCVRMNAHNSQMRYGGEFTF